MVWLPGPEWVPLMGRLPDSIVVDLWCDGEELPPSAAEAEVVIKPFQADLPKMSVLARLPRLRFVQTLGAGVENVLPHLPPGVTLCNAAGLHDTAVAEWIISAILAQLRELPRYVAAQRQGAWSALSDDELAGKAVLIVGYGSIGKAVERRLAGWDVSIERVARRQRGSIHGVDDLYLVLPKADVVIILVPRTEETERMVDAKFLGSMKDGALLVNAARGAIVDTGALMAELCTGRLRAALDVTEPEPLPCGHPLWSVPGLLITPHIAGSTRKILNRTAPFIRAQLTRYAEGRPLLNVVGSNGY